MVPGNPFQPAMPRQTGIWIRVSTEDQASGDSPEHHERRARAYAESKGWHVREVYRLEAVSGKSVKDHPEAKRMLSDVQAGRISALIFSKLARLARNTRELLDFADYFRVHGADLVSLQESIDTSSPAGRLFYTMIAAMAQWEREEIAERVAASVPIRAKLGKRLGGEGPFGYRWDGHRLAPDPREAPIRVLLHELFLEHKRCRTVARLLNERGLRTRRGRPFTGTTVRRLLEDPTAKGLRRANYTRSMGKKARWALKPESEWVHVPVEPIVAPEVWERCFAMLEERRVTGKVPGRKPQHLFTGFLRCRCGQRMYVPWRSERYTCYGCRTSIKAPDLETIFREQLRAFLVDPAEIAKHLGKADADIRTREERLAALEAEAGRVQLELDRLYQLYASENITPDGYGRMARSLEERRRGLEDEVPRLRGELDFLRIQYLSKDEILAEGRDLHDRWPTLGREEQRAIVEALVRAITVGKQEVEVELAFHPDSPQIAAERPRGPPAVRRARGARTAARRR